MNIDELLSTDFQKVVMLGGLPGLGKSTFRKDLTDYFIICKDDIRLFFAQQEYGNLPEYLLQDRLEEFSNRTKYLVPILIEYYLNYQYLSIPINTYRH